MSAIVTNNTSALCHYLSYQNNTITDFPRGANLSITGALTLAASNVLANGAWTALVAATTKVFAAVTTITDIATDMQILVKDGVTVGGVQFIPVTNGGSGYVAGATVTLTGSTGSGMVATPVLVNGVITSIAISTPGVYTVAPTGATITGGSGTGATLGVPLCGLGVAVVKGHSGIDAIFPFTAGFQSGVYVLGTPAGTGLTFSVTNGSPAVGIDVMLVSDTAWLSLGQNWNEGLSFTKGVMTTPIARGWNATDHAARVRSVNHMSIKQLYSSMLEGVAHLRGKTILIMDQVYPDGGSVIKETHYVVSATCENAALTIGGGGGAAMVDSVDLSGYFSHMYTWTQDATALATTF